MQTLQVIFLCCDIGETAALTPVMHDLKKKEINFNILAMGAAINRLEDDNILKDKVIKIKEPVDTSKARTKPLENVTENVNDLQPLLVISGPASKAQEQLLQALPAKKKIVYLDNFNYPITNPSFATVKEVISAGQKIICVSDIVKDQILKIESMSLKEKNVKPLGRPSLENWVNQVQEIDKIAVLQKIGFNEKKIVTFIGGYGPRYEQGVNAAYDEATETLKNAGYQVHIQHHPNVVKNQPLTTIEAVGMADYVVCYDSTVGFEALFAGKTVIYLQPKSVELYDNIAIQKKLASVVQNGEELLGALQPSLQPKEDIYTVLGVKKKSSEAITSYILKKLDKMSK